MRIREIYKPKPKGIKYTIYRGEKPAAFHDSGIPMGTEMPRKAFMHGVPSKLINHIMDKLAKEVPSEKFYTELEEGLPAKIATAAGISLAGDIVAKGIKKIAKKIKDDPKDADEELEEAPMGPIAKGLATAAATASMAGAVSADPGSDEKYDNREPGTPEYNAPRTNDQVEVADLKQYEQQLRQLAVNFMKQQKYFSGIWPKGTAGPTIISSDGEVYMPTRKIGKDYIQFSTRYKEAALGAAPPNASNGAVITIKFGEFSRGEKIPGMDVDAYSINRPSPTTITSVDLDVLNDGVPDVARYAYKKFAGKVPHLSDQKFTKPGQMQAAGFYDLIGKDISEIK
jgi:hypothetical protein